MCGNLVLPELDAQYRGGECRRPKCRARADGTKSTLFPELARVARRSSGDIGRAGERRWRQGQSLYWNRRRTGWGDAFIEEWLKADEIGNDPTFLSMVDGAALPGRGSRTRASLTEEESELRETGMALTLRQIWISTANAGQIFGDLRGKSMQRTTRAASRPAAIRCLSWRRLSTG